MEYKVLEWKTDYETGNEGVDYQHKSLINTINDIIETYNSSNGEPNGVLIEVPLDELFKFAAHTFAPEELLMQTHKYPKLVEHHELHIQFVLSLIQLKIRLDKDENIGKDLIDFILNWIHKHIMVEDKAAMQACR